jgi:polyribonucleotide 5'-hydroxyl-kinase
MNAATAQLGGEAATEMTLSPFSTTLDVNDLKIYRVGDSTHSLEFHIVAQSLTNSPTATLAPSSALPIGASRAIGEMQPVRVELDSGGILHSVLALLAPFESNPSDDALLQQEVAGFLIVSVHAFPLSFALSDR